MIKNTDNLEIRKIEPYINVTLRKLTQEGENWGYHLKRSVVGWMEILRIIEHCRDDCCKMA